jgi:hypothetical protein
MSGRTAGQGAHERPGHRYPHCGTAANQKSGNHFRNFNKILSSFMVKTNYGTIIPRI